jgi:hypothetical protein
MTPPVWTETKECKPTRDDAPNRMQHVIWMVCDGFVCEPTVQRWDWTCPLSCHAVAWMPIPDHPKWYPKLAGGFTLNLAP